MNTVVNAWNGGAGNGQLVSTDQRIPVTVLREKDDMFDPLGIMESAEEREDRLISEFADSQRRAYAMAAVLEWAYSLDYSKDNLDALIRGGAILESADEDEDEDEDDFDEDEDYDEDEEDEITESVATAMIHLGADADSVIRMFETGDDTIAESVGNFLLDRLDGDAVASDATIISRFAVLEGAVLEAITFVRDGKIIKKKRRRGRPKRMTAKQKAGLKKAQRKSHSGAAEHEREKSMKVRKQRGM